MKTKEEVFTGFKMSGILMLILNILLTCLITATFIWAVDPSSNGNPIKLTVIIIDLILFIFNCIFWGGFMQIEPNEAMVLLFFGKYSGTIKENGFYWVNPFYTKRKLTLRARNLDAEPIKVNDKSGNPIMIGVVVVWHVSDTYKATFDIDSESMLTAVAASSATHKVNERMKSYQNFVKVQSDSALRSVAGMYSYDQNGLDNPNDLTLRSGGEEVNDILENQLNERLSIAGIHVIEARINYLAYAPEIAAVMLRRQQADAIIAAREKIVDGAVGMVKMALNKLSEEKVVELDEEKKAAMVSNLLVVLCSDENASPVLNTGTLYN